MKNGLYINEFDTERWYVNDKLHRTDGPALVFIDGTQKWYQNGLRHREDGPAVVYPSGQKVWYINNQFIAETEDEFKTYVIKQNLNQLL